MPSFYLYNDDDPSQRTRSDMSTHIFSAQATEPARAFHASFPEYAPTPLLSLPGLAAELGLGHVLVKDESGRFGLDSFKVLGATWAVARQAANTLGLDATRLALSQLLTPVAREALGAMVVTAASFGNYGRALAWTARRLGLRAEIFMPAGSDPARVQAVRALGASCRVTGGGFSDAARVAAQTAGANGWTLVQNSSSDEERCVSAWIMQGFTTIAAEALAQVRALGLPLPTHVLLQSGVGAFPGAILGYLVEELGEKAPMSVIVEPEEAACVLRSAIAGDGRPHPVKGHCTTIMAGLACSRPCPFAWPILHNHMTGGIACPDHIAADGMRVLASPLPGDPRVIAGESGAVTAGALAWLMNDAEAADGREALGLGPGSCVLLVNTEGATSPSLWKDVVWHGAYGRLDMA